MAGSKKVRSKALLTLADGTPVYPISPTWAQEAVSLPLTQGHFGYKYSTADGGELAFAYHPSHALLMACPPQGNASEAEHFFKAEKMYLETEFTHKEKAIAAAFFMLGLSFAPPAIRREAEKYKRNLKHGRIKGVSRRKEAAKLNHEKIQKALNDLYRQGQGWQWSYPQIANFLIERGISKYRLSQTLKLVKQFAPQSKEKYCQK